MVEQKLNKAIYHDIMGQKVKNFLSVRAKQFEQSTKNQIEIDTDEIKDICIAISPFIEEEISYKFIRTEPVIHMKLKGHDVLIYGNETALLVEIKETILPDNSISNINDFVEKSKSISNTEKRNIEVLGKELSILEFLERLVGSKINKLEFILASERAKSLDVNEKAQKLVINFYLWLLSEKSNKAHIVEEVIRGIPNSESFYHSDKSLSEYIRFLSKNGCKYKESVSFLYSSSNDLKAINITIPLLYKAKEFDYNIWCKIFHYDILNWFDVEKETIYKHYIDYGLSCGFIICVENRNNKLLDKYKIISRAIKTSLVRQEIISKIVKNKVNDILKSNIEKLKEEARKETLKKQLGTKTLSDFMGGNSNDN